MPSFSRDGWTSWFAFSLVVAILKHGNGPTVMLRTDLDALPVQEDTPLPFASQKKVLLDGGAESRVMHACGHDVHMSNLIGVAEFMSAHQEAWSGTLMLIGQPAEERGAGAKAMLADGLFERFPKPDFALALPVGIKSMVSATVDLMPARR
jgi:metal-dependent amidase/aminoacylase/carboxypeptidase family protein